MSKFLFLAGAYYPAPKANGICCERVISELQKRGHQVDMVAFAPNLPGPDHAVVGNVNVSYIKGSLYYRTLRAEESGLAAGTTLRRKKLLLKLTHMALAPGWPNTSPAANNQFYRKACELHEKNHYDVVVGVNSPFSALFAAAKLKEHFPQLKFAAYFLDSLSGGATPKFFSPETGMKMGLRWEKKLLKNADSVIIMKSHMAHHEQYSKNMAHYSKIKVLDIPLLMERTSQEPPHHTGPVHIVYVGAINSAVKDPTYMLKLSGMLPESCRFDFYGAIDKPELFADHLNQPNLSIHGEVPHAEALEAQRNADFLLNIGSSNTCQIPCKIFEYMSTGKPIITTCPIENEPSLPYLRKYGACFEVHEDPARLDENARALARFITDYTGAQVDPSYVAKEFSGNMPGSFADEMDRLLKE